MNRIWLLLMCAGVAGAADDTVKLAPTSIEMPKRIGPLVQTGEPYRFEPAALGYGYQYDGAGLRLTVYVYDMGYTDIPDGADTVPACMQFEEAKAEIGQAGYGHPTLKTEQLV